MTWKVILKALRRKAFKITFFPFWYKEMGVDAPLRALTFQVVSDIRNA